LNELLGSLFLLWRMYLGVEFVLLETRNKWMDLEDTIFAEGFD
jgi:hypothetical protein